MKETVEVPVVKNTRIFTATTYIYMEVELYFKKCAEGGSQGGNSDDKFQLGRQRAGFC